MNCRSELFLVPEAASSALRSTCEGGECHAGCIAAAGPLHQHDEHDPRRYQPGNELNKICLLN
jgi:hypothetical protein